MSVFTNVSPDELSSWLIYYDLGELEVLEGIASGIENTNYFVTTSKGRYVLTLFEKLTEEELPFYLNLMAHLAKCGIPCPSPIPNKAQHLLGFLNGKPASLVTCLTGKSVEAPTIAHCEKVGEMLARMHAAGGSFPEKMDNPRGEKWWTSVMPELAPFLQKEDSDLLQDEILFQSAQKRDALPQGIIHADLFRDNVLFENEKIGGIIDFYFACNDSFLFDIAITANDWCMDLNQSLNREKARAFLNAYNKVRPLSPEEKGAWPAMLRAAALRFWVSRLYDFHLPRAGELTHAKDPGHFEAILKLHRENPDPVWI